ncbi:MAG: mevalonate kinase [Candidatus Levybacteria bacterium RIFCSPLOWO2_12_FULL_39_17]|nr:MAG: Mevalonate kinase [Candidatus Levybacteria bacterium GW2011_GWA1_39_11]OGH48622.1 MAG: mevalonate kinase [Candidatus Levybacteria bacterium RIFCSPLOWO2_12_FULL_39_17]
MNKVTVSTPGKLMLFGEHAVVYGHPCIVTAVDQRIRLAAEVLDSPDFILEAGDVEVTNYTKQISELGQGDVPKGAQFVEIALKNIYEKFDLGEGLRITTASEFSSKFGFGSSSAITVCVVKALSELFDLKLDNKEIFDSAYKTVLDIQGKGSGFDVAAGIYGGCLYFVTGGKVIEPLIIKELPLIVGYSGVKADTVTLMNQVKAKASKYPEFIDVLYTEVSKLVEKAKSALLVNDLISFGELMNFNQGLLESMGVSIAKLSAMIYGARDEGAYGAKLSGAGGGDCMIAIAPKDKIAAVQQGITRSGGQVIEVQTNVEGVRIEK